MNSENFALQFERDKGVNSYTLWICNLLIFLDFVYSWRRYKQRNENRIIYHHFN